MTATEIQVTECGIIDGCQVRAVTDGIGPQVAVMGGDIHLLSQILPTHQEAEALGLRVAQQGASCYSHWMNFNNLTEVEEFCDKHGQRHKWETRGKE